MGRTAAALAALVLDGSRGPFVPEGLLIIVFLQVGAMSSANFASPCLVANSRACAASIAASGYFCISAQAAARISKLLASWKPLSCRSLFAKRNAPWPFAPPPWGWSRTARPPSGNPASIRRVSPAFLRSGRAVQRRVHSVRRNWTTSFRCFMACAKRCSASAVWPFFFASMAISPRIWA